MSDDGSKSLKTIAAELASDFAKRLIGPSLDQTGSLAADWMRFWRMKNWNLIRDRAEKYHERRKLKGKSVPVMPGVAMLALQNAPFEDDPNIQDMWARLLVNAMDPERADAVSKLSVRLLSELDPLDARILEYLGLKGPMSVHQSSAFIQINGVTLLGVSGVMDVSQAKARVSLHNLHRLGLVADERINEAYMARSSRQQKTVSIMSTGFLRTEESRLHTTALGYALLEACKE